MKDIEIGDKNLFVNKLGDIINSEYQFSTLLIWQNSYRFQYEEYEGNLLVFGYQHNGALQCYYPVGCVKNLSTVIDRIKQIFRSKGYRYNFRPLNEKMKASLVEQLGPYIVVGTKESYSDYIYDFEDLKSYRGNKYKRKRKEWHQFDSRYNYTYEPINLNNSAKSLNALIRIVKMERKYDPMEIIAYKRIFKYFQALNFRGGIIRINGIVEAVAVGEAIGNMVLMHARRANKEYTGIYPAILHLVLNNEFNDSKYAIVNTQDDMGIENVRKAKMSYKPIEIMKKFYVEELAHD